LVFTVVAAASLSSGALYATVGWAAMNSLVAGSAAIVLVAVALFVRRQRVLPASRELQEAS
jgi:hypothetical protein